jgi:drug/metabolite transporter (DMT)-like permease
MLPASLAGMLLYTYPAQVSILAVIMGDEKFNWKKGAALGVCFAGLALVLDASFKQVSAVGFAVGISAATVYSFYIVLGNRLLKKADALVTTTLVCSAAAFVFVVYGCFSGQLIFTLPFSGWVALAGMAVFATVIAILCFFAGMSHVGASNASILSTIEPVITVILSWFILGETISLVQLAGGVLILIGVLALQMVIENSSN